MPKLNRITTRSGDSGETSLSDGSRVAKSSPRVCAYGTIDELNSVIGLVRCEELPAGLAEKICQIQNQLFELGGELSTPPASRTGTPGGSIGQQDIEQLEAWLHQTNQNLQPTATFILPGGSRAAALCHLARTVARRAEREVAALACEEPAESFSLRYLNRLSDLFFVWARLCNDAGRSDLLWERNRG